MSHPFQDDFVPDYEDYEPEDDELSEEETSPQSQIAQHIVPQPSEPQASGTHPPTISCTDEQQDPNPPVLRDHLSQTFPNMHKRDRQLIEAQKYCIGHALVCFAGPFCFFNLVQVTRLNDRPLSGPHIGAMEHMYSNDLKHDWMHPLMVQVRVEDLPQDQKEHMAKVDPRSAESAEAKVLKLHPHNDSLEELSYEVWSGFAGNGALLDDETWALKKAELVSWMPSAPPVTLLQGAHRCAAMQQFAGHANTLCADMREHKRNGDMEQFQAAKEELNGVIERAMFLVSVYPANLPPEYAQLLSENEAPYPTSGPTFGEECSQLHTLALSLGKNGTQCFTYQDMQKVRGIVVSRQKNLATYSDAGKRVINHPLLLQMACQNPVMIPVWSQHLMGASEGLVRDGMGLLERKSFHGPKLRMLKDFVRMTPIPPQGYNMAQSLWQETPQLSRTTILHQSFIYSLDIERKYIELWRRRIPPVLVTLFHQSQPINWRNDQVISASRQVFWELGDWITQVQPAWCQNFGNALCVYAVMQTSDPNVPFPGFCPEASLPSGSLFKALGNRYHWMSNEIVSDLIGLSMLPAYVMWHANAASVPESADGTSLEATHQVVYRALLQVSENTSAIHLLAQPELYNHFSELDAIIPRCLGISSLDSLPDHMKTIKEKLGLGPKLAPFKAKQLDWVCEQIDHSSWAATALGQREQVYTSERRALRAWMNKKGSQSATQLDLMVSKAPNLLQLMPEYWAGIDVTKLLSAYSGRHAVDNASDQVINIGLYSQFLLQKVALPAFRTSASARALFALGPTFLGRETWWQQQQSFVLRLMEPLAPGVDILPQTVSTPEPEAAAPQLPTASGSGTGPSPNSTSGPIAHACSGAGAGASLGSGSFLGSSARTRPTRKAPLPLFSAATSEVHVTTRITRKTAGPAEGPLVVPQTDNPQNDDLVDTDLELTDEAKSDEEKSDEDDDGDDDEELGAVNAGVPEMFWHRRQTQVPDTIPTVLHEVRFPHVPTRDQLPNFIHNIIATRLAVRDQTALLATPDPDDQALEEIVTNTKEVMKALDGVRTTSILDLVSKAQTWTLGGPVALINSLGALVEMFKNEYLIKIVLAMRKAVPGLSEDEAINEAMRILCGDGFQDAELISWDVAGDGSVVVDVGPLLAAGVRAEYSGSTRVLAGQVKLDEADRDIFPLAHRLAKPYGTGWTSHLSRKALREWEDKASMGALPGYVKGLPVTRYEMEEMREDGTVVLTKTSEKQPGRHKPTRFKGSKHSAFSSGRFVESTELPPRTGDDRRRVPLQAKLVQLQRELGDAWKESAKLQVDSVCKLVGEEVGGLQQMKGMAMAGSGSGRIGKKRAAEESGDSQKRARLEDMGEDVDEDAIDKRMRMMRMRMMLRMI
ncbi:hypothetical protein FRC06_003581, partial [Ceratobasidium sp. 370]